MMQLPNGLSREALNRLMLVQRSYFQEHVVRILSELRDTWERVARINIKDYRYRIPENEPDFLNLHCLGGMMECTRYNRNQFNSSLNKVRKTLPELLISFEDRNARANFSVQSALRNTVRALRTFEAPDANKPLSQTHVDCAWLPRLNISDASSWIESYRLAYTDNLSEEPFQERWLDQTPIQLRMPQIWNMRRWMPKGDHGYDL
ncbi:hypothetical protein BJ508DRAFT_416665 [Ascobolus immersus RN42]|uniref:Uncharacterized protein n=1 Tax=Ascobolus immersus RN42 TaxID=1160509 RepID=A0A3N4I082_ASCIM|nr:hypothetical protein BJ508DRAFT_416665 [Ascobolus immersus RN42]